MTLSGAFLHRRELVHVYCRIEGSEESRFAGPHIVGVGEVVALRYARWSGRPIRSGGLLAADWSPECQFALSRRGSLCEPGKAGTSTIPACSGGAYGPLSCARFDPPLDIRSGNNISTGGFCIFSVNAGELRVGRLYEIELTLPDAGQSGETFIFLAELRWLLRSMEGAVAGLQLFDRTKQRDLARLVTYMEHRMSRHPEDYLLETNPRPDMSQLH